MLNGKSGDCGRTGVDHRLFVEAVLWMEGTVEFSGVTCLPVLGRRIRFSGALPAGRAKLSSRQSLKSLWSTDKLDMSSLKHSGSGAVCWRIFVRRKFAFLPAQEG